jgi:hypothetical protein
MKLVPVTTWWFQRAPLGRTMVMKLSVLMIILLPEEVGSFDDDERWSEGNKEVNVDNKKSRKR